VEPNIGEQIKRRLNQVLVATVALYIVVIVVAWLAWRQSSGDHAALCAFKGGLENQVSASDAFLKKHPNGVHAVHSWHHPDAHGIGHAADMGLEDRLVGTQEGLRRMVSFQHHESQDPSRFNELFGPDNFTNVKNGSHMTLAEGTALENQHDNHVHGAPRR
jgi:hypothetical protein